jgi:hypothetical protein
MIFSNCKTFWTLIVAPATGIIPNQSDVCVLLEREKHLSRHHSQVGANQSFDAISFWHLRECDAHIALCLNRASLSSQ